jgi:type VI secretion system protein ImpK
LKTIGQPILVGLPDACVDIISFALQLKGMKDPGDPEAFRTKVNELFQIFDTRASGAGVSPPNAALAKYALAAFVDEIVLNSSWSLKDSWSGRPLQLEYFNDFAAGEEFFNKLDTLRHTEDPKRIEVLEVYFLLLALGFKGKYGGFEGLEKLRRLTDDISKELRRARGTSELSAPSSAAATQVPQMVRDFPVWMVLVACAGILLVLYVVLAWLLGGSASTAVGEMGGPR